MTGGESLGQQAASGVIWMTAQKWVSRVSALFTVVLLARVLSPEDFGVAAAAGAMMPLVYVLSDVGFSTYIVQASDVGDRVLSTAFWFSLASGSVLALGIFVLAKPIGSLLGEPEVGTILQVMTASVVIIALGSVPLALMRRRLAFRSLALMEFVATLLAQAIAVAAALLGAGAWALVMQLMVAQTVTTSWVWWSARWRPRAQFSRQDFHLMGAFGLQVVGTGLASVIREWITLGMVVASLGVREAGFLNIASRLVTTVQDMTSAALMPVAMATFARIRDSPDRLRSSYLRASALSYAAATPLMVLVGVSAAVLIPFLFGDDKGPSATITPALAATSVIYIGLNLDQGLHFGMGKPGRWLVFVIVTYSVTIAFTAVSVSYGLYALTLAWVAAGLLELIARWVVVGRLINVSTRRVAAPVLAVVPPSAIAIGSGLLVLYLLDGLPQVLVLSVLGIVVLAAYVVTVRVLQPATFADALAVVPDRFSHRARRIFRQPLAGEPSEA